MASKARELANLGNAYSDGALSNRNRIINGSFQIWQRGTSFTSDGYGADRWSIAFGSNTGTVSRQSFTVGQTDVPDNPAYYLRFNISSYSSEFSIFNKVEDVSTLAGQTAVLSFYMKADSALTVSPFMVQNFGSGGSSNVNTALSTISVTTSWQRFEITISVPSISGKTVGSSSYLQIMPLRVTSSFTGNIDIANVQLEVGDTATPFEHRSYGQELALCQRYYNRLAKVNPTENLLAIGFWNDSTHAITHCQFPMPMRALPTVGYSSLSHLQNIKAGVAWYTVTALSAQAMLTHTRLYTTVGTSQTAGDGSELRFDAAAPSTCYLDFDAEL